MESAGSAMNFDEFIAAGWAEHGTQPEAVAARLADALPLLDGPGKAAPFARLLTHVYGEHLARWPGGIALLESARALPALADDAEDATAVTRAIAVLRYAGNLETDLASLPAGEGPAVLAAAAAILAGRREFSRAIAAYREAVSGVTPGSEAEAVAARALAIAGNNLAAVLEGKPDRDAGESADMIGAAEGGLRFWKLAGGWLEEERAEYRLASSLLAAGDAARAAGHARRCLQICDEQQAPAFERFFAQAILAAVSRAAGDDSGAAQARAAATQAYAQLAPDEQRHCEAELSKLGD